MSNQLERPRGRVPLRGFWPALGVAAVTFAVWGLAAWADGTTAQRTERATAGQTVRLSAAAGEGGVMVAPIPEWTIVATGSTTSLHLEHEGALVVVDFADEVPDAQTFFTRKTRELDASSDVEVIETGEATSATGFTGRRGTAAADGREGELVVMAKDEKAVTVLSLSDPAGAAQTREKVAAMISSIEVEK